MLSGGTRPSGSVAPKQHKRYAKSSHMHYSALIEDRTRLPHLRKVLIVNVRDEKEARRLLWERDEKVRVCSIGPLRGIDVLTGDWEGDEAVLSGEGDNDLQR